MSELFEGIDWAADAAATRHPDRSDERRLEVQLAAAQEEIANLRSEVAMYRATVDSYQETFEAAAGELLVPIPEPGTMAAKMLAANSLMRRQRDESRDRAAKAEKAWNDLLAHVARTKADDRERLDKGQGTWPMPDYVTDDAFAYRRGHHAALDALMQLAERLTRP